MNRCDGCGQRIEWVRMQDSGKAIPIDPDLNDRGNVVAVGPPHRVKRGRVVPAGKPIAEHEDRYMPHFATCPARDRHNGAPTRPPTPLEPQVSPEQAALFDGLDP